MTRSRCIKSLVYRIYCFTNIGLTRPTLSATYVVYDHGFTRNGKSILIDFPLRVMGVHMVVSLGVVNLIVKYIICYYCWDSGLISNAWTGFRLWVRLLLKYKLVLAFYSKQSVQIIRLFRGWILQWSKICFTVIIKPKIRAHDRTVAIFPF